MLNRAFCHFPFTSYLVPLNFKPPFASVMATALPETASPWAPNMVFRARRNKDVPKTLCERFIEEQVVTFIREYFPMGGPNFDYGPVMERATWFVMYIVSTYCS